MSALRKRSTILILIVSCLLILLSSGGFFTVYLTHTIKDDASIINELGIIRGSIQRLVKFEANGIENNEIINDIELNINKFKNEKIGSSEGDKINEALENLGLSWDKLKDRIYEYRDNPTMENKSTLLKESEDMWNKANIMVLASQLESEKKVDYYSFSFVLFGINIILGIIIIFLIKRYVKDTLEYMVKYDGLTKVYNRRYFDEYLNREIIKCERYDRNLSLIIFDIDYFKKVNDTYGHDVGDSVLKELSRLVETNIRKSDVFSRVGGEEFAIIAPEINIDNALILSEKIRKVVENHDFKFVNNIRISLGVTEFISSDDSDTIYKRADKALYKAKNAGKNRSEIELGQVNSKI